MCVCQQQISHTTWPISLIFFVHIYDIMLKDFLWLWWFIIAAKPILLPVFYLHWLLYFSGLSYLSWPALVRKQPPESFGIWSVIPKMSTAGTQPACWKKEIMSCINVCRQGMLQSVAKLTASLLAAQALNCQLAAAPSIPPRDLKLWCCFNKYVQKVCYPILKSGKICTISSDFIFPHIKSEENSNFGLTLMSLM